MKLGSSNFWYTFTSKVYQKLEGYVYEYITKWGWDLWERFSLFFFAVIMYIVYSYTYQSNFWYNFISKVYQKLDKYVYEYLIKWGLGLWERFSLFFFGIISHSSLSNFWYTFAMKVYQKLDGYVYEYIIKWGLGRLTFDILSFRKYTKS